MEDDDKSNRNSSGDCKVALAEIVAIAIEQWRLSTWIESAGGNIGTARHAARRISDVLSKWQVEARSLDGRPFDAGLAAKVVDTVDDPSVRIGTDTVDETVSPMVLFRGTVIRPAEIVVRRGTGR